MARELTVQSFVAPSMEQLAKALAEMHERLAMLEERLNPVLRSSKDRPTVARGDDTRQEGESAFAREMESLVTTAHNRVSFIEDLIERVEL